jgi:hypothetical protein
MPATVARLSNALFRQQRGRFKGGRRQIPRETTPRKSDLIARNLCVDKNKTLIATFPALLTFGPAVFGQYSTTVNLGCNEDDSTCTSLMSPTRRKHKIQHHRWYPQRFCWPLYRFPVFLSFVLSFPPVPATMLQDKWCNVSPTYLRPEKSNCVAFPQASDIAVREQNAAIPFNQPRA